MNGKAITAAGISRAACPSGTKNTGDDAATRASRGELQKVRSPQGTARDPRRGRQAEAISLINSARDSGPDVTSGSNFQCWDGSKSLETGRLD